MIRTRTPGKKRNSEVLKKCVPIAKEYFPWEGFIPLADPGVVTVLTEEVRKTTRPPTTPLIGFSSERSLPKGVLRLETTVGTYALGGKGGDQREISTSRHRQTSITPGNNQLVQLVANSLGVFAWTSADMTGVLRELVEHRPGLNEYATPISQKRRSLPLERLASMTM
ncbi:hypothetical protein Tco_0448132 [Tanacetum coccineum]